MKPYTMVLPSTALFGSSFGSMFLKTIGNSNASLLMILVFAFVITYSIGYLFMRRPHVACGGASLTSQAGAAGDERAKQSAASGAAKDETTPLLGGSEDEEDEDASSSASEANNEETR